ncbi:hypothetical protein BH09ACT7_BH09ACT7_03630 [soil metagenome]
MSTAPADVAYILSGTLPPALQVRLGLAHPPKTVDLGANWYTAAVKHVVDYPARVARPWLGDSIRQGVHALEAGLRATDGPVIVVALSQGTVVVDLLLARLAEDPAAPPAAQISFITISAPNRGLFSRLPKGTNLLGYRVIRPVESRYSTTVITGEYDLWSDPPDRPWNLAAALNAIAGARYVHVQAATVASPADVPAENVSVRTNCMGATVTEVLVPTKKLPLLQPLRNIGVPVRFVNFIEKPLRRVVNRGYKRHDEKAP